MNVVVTEHFESRSLTHGNDGQESTLELVLNVMGTSSEQEAMSAAKAWAPTVWNPGPPRLYRQRVSISPAGPTLWRTTVFYDTTDPALSAENSFEMDTTGGVERITQSLATRAAHGYGAVPSFDGAIGVSDSGVDGCDKVVPRPVFSFTKYYGEVSAAYRTLLINLTGTVNAFPFQGFAAGEVLFLGANVRRNDSRYGTPWIVTYQFAASRNRTNFYVGGIPVALKYGWDYLWARYAPTIDTGTGVLVRRPAAVYIERIYEGADLNALGI